MPVCQFFTPSVQVGLTHEPLALLGVQASVQSRFLQAPRRGLRAALWWAGHGQTWHWAEAMARGEAESGEGASRHNSSTARSLVGVDVLA